ncbi:MAG: hypothetical protein R6U57_13425 [Anaerolineales bacterium]
MAVKDKKQKSSQWSLMGACIAGGLIVGGLVGLNTDNLVVFSGGGMILGLSLGYALEKRRQDQIQ